MNLNYRDRKWALRFRILECVSCFILLALAILLLTIKTVLRLYIVVPLMVFSAAFGLICLYSLCIFNTQQTRSLYRSWIAFATAGMALFFLTAGFLVIPTKFFFVSILLSASISAAITVAIIFLLDILFIMRHLHLGLYPDEEPIQIFTPTFTKQSSPVTVCSSCKLQCTENQELCSTVSPEISRTVPPEKSPFIHLKIGDCDHCAEERLQRDYICERDVCYQTETESKSTSITPVEEEEVLVHIIEKTQAKPPHPSCSASLCKKKISQISRSIQVGPDAEVSSTLVKSNIIPITRMQTKSAPPVTSMFSSKNDCVTCAEARLQRGFICERDICPLAESKSTSITPVEDEKVLVFITEKTQDPSCRASICKKMLQISRSIQVGPEPEERHKESSSLVKSNISPIIRMQTKSALSKSTSITSEEKMLTIQKTPAKSPSSSCRPSICKKIFQNTRSIQVGPEPCDICAEERLQKDDICEKGICSPKGTVSKSTSITPVEALSAQIIKKKTERPPLPKKISQNTESIQVDLEPCDICAEERLQKDDICEKGICPPKGTVSKSTSMTPAEALSAQIIKKKTERLPLPPPKKISQNTESIQVDLEPCDICAEERLQKDDICEKGICPPKGTVSKSTSMTPVEALSAQIIKKKTVLPPSKKISQNSRSIQVDPEPQEVLSSTLVKSAISPITRTPTKSVPPVSSMQSPEADCDECAEKRRQAGFICDTDTCCIKGTVSKSTSITPVGVSSVMINEKRTEHPAMPPAPLMGTSKKNFQITRSTQIDPEPKEILPSTIVESDVSHITTTRTKSAPPVPTYDKDKPSTSMERLLAQIVDFRSTESDQRKPYKTYQNTSTSSSDLYFKEPDIKKTYKNTYTSTSNEYVNDVVDQDIFENNRCKKISKSLQNSSRVGYDDYEPERKCLRKSCLANGPKSFRNSCTSCNLLCDELEPTVCSNRKQKVCLNTSGSCSERNCSESKHLMLQKSYSTAHYIYVTTEAKEQPSKNEVVKSPSEETGQVSTIDESTKTNETTQTSDSLVAKKSTEKEARSVQNKVSPQQPLIIVVNESANSSSKEVEDVTIQVSDLFENSNLVPVLSIDEEVELRTIEQQFSPHKSTQFSNRIYCACNESLSREGICVHCCKRQRERILKNKQESQTQQPPVLDNILAHQPFVYETRRNGLDENTPRVKKASPIFKYVDSKAPRRPSEETSVKYYSARLSQEAKKPPKKKQTSLPASAVFPKEKLRNISSEPPKK